MSIDIAVIMLGALLVAAALTGAVRRLAIKHQLIDHPNARSSHVSPTPRGGGIAIAVSVSLALIVLVMRGELPWALFMALMGGGVAVAILGFLDDRRPMPACVRLLGHFAAAIWALAWLGGLPPLQIDGRIVALGWVGNLVGVLGIVWALNLFNFMDGIDGIAASEAIFVVFASTLLEVAGVEISSATAPSLVLGAACVGFLLWNWPPAKIFMGDVGSGYVGYIIAVLALAAARQNHYGLWLWLILGGVFFVDATVTLVRRLGRRERVLDAHRSHAYQWLARRWASHRRVTLAVIGVNVVWLLPFALIAAKLPQYSLQLTIGALIPLALIALASGAGRPEHQ